MNALLSYGPFLCLVTALCFAAWPLIGRATGASGAWVTVVVMLVTPIVAGVPQYKQLSELPSWQGIGILILAGACNGIGMVAYGKIVTDRQFEMSGLAPASLVGMVVLIMLGGVLFFHEPITARKILGLVLACIAVWLLG